GEKSMVGAGILCSRAASRAGAGHVTWYSPAFSDTWGDFHVPEVITQDLSQTTDWGLFRSVVLGPGIRSWLSIEKTVRDVFEHPEARGVLDADAIQSLQKMRPKNPENWVITPHAGELARLMNVDS